MGPKERLAQLKNESAALLQKNKAGTFTDQDADRAQEIAKEVAGLQDIIRKGEAASKALGALAGVTQSSNPGGVGEDDDAAGYILGQSGNRQKVNPHQVPAADATKFTDNFMKALKAAAPTVGGPFAQKALAPNGAIVSNFEQVIVHDPRNAFSLYAAVQHAPAGDANGGSYLRQTARTNNAGTVKNGDLKPISQFTLTPQKWRAATVAHLSEPMQRQWFEDFTNLEAFVSSEMAYGLDQAVADMILNGGTDEDGETFTGILNTSGIGQTAYATSPLRTIRKAITDLQVTGAVPTSITLHPTAWETIESSLTTEGAYILDGAPQSAVTPQLFGLPVILSTGIGADEAIIGDLNSVVIYDKGNVMHAWSEAGQHNAGTAEAPQNVDLFRANQLVWRTEIRLGLSITSTKTLRIAALAGA